MKINHCIRLYDKDGKHILSLVYTGMCGEGVVDLADPDGHVLFCGVENEEYGLPSTLKYLVNLGLEEPLQFDDSAQGAD